MFKFVYENELRIKLKSYRKLIKIVFKSIKYLDGFLDELSNKEIDFITIGMIKLRKDDIVYCNFVAKRRLKWLKAKD